jgi:two-component system invasion response regulator UvrY
MIKVIITDDHPVVRRGIRQILEDDIDIGIIHEAGSGKELIESLLENEYDVLLLDITLPGRSGIELISQVMKVRPSIAILMLSIHAEGLYAIKSLKQGAMGYLTKESAPEELLSAIHKLARGEKYISASLADKLANYLLSDSEVPLHDLLSAREIEVLKLFSEGKTVGQIAIELSLSPKTISTYRGRMLTKLKLKNSAELIRYAIMEGITGRE